MMLDEKLMNEDHITLLELQALMYKGMYENMKRLDADAIDIIDKLRTALEAIIKVASGKDGPRSESEMMQKVWQIARAALEESYRREQS